MASLIGGSGGSNILPGRGLVNPAFVIKIVSATDDLQQDAGHSRNNPNDDFLSNLAIGDDIDVKQDGKDISGSVQRVIKNSLGDVIYVIITDQNGKTHKINSTNIHSRKKFKKDLNDDSLVSSPAVFNESKFLSFSDFFDK